MSLEHSLPSRRSNYIAKLAGLALLLSLAAPASAQTPVGFGSVITDPGIYFLAGNQTGAGSDGIKIASDDVLLLLGRFTLRGDGNYVGIICAGNDNVTIWGGRITSFENAIVMADGHDCMVKDTRIDHCTGDGFAAVLVKDSWFLRLHCDHNAWNGVYGVECSGSRFVSIRSHDNGYSGFFFFLNVGFAGVPELIGSKVRLCWAAYNGRDGIRVQDTNDHELIQNQCVNNAGAGIRLRTGLPEPTAASLAIAGPRDVLVKRNWCVFNHEGIVVDQYAQDNTLTENIALANFGPDMVEGNDAPPCANTWFLNFFLTKDGDGAICIF